MYGWGKVAIVGVGLIGGSIGLALRQRGLAREVAGVGRNAARLAAAKRRGAIDSSTTHLIRGVADAELVVVGTPVEQVCELLPEIVDAAPLDCHFTDVGSTKAGLVAAVERSWPADRELRFLGSHPLAGSDRTGVEHSRGDLFEQRTVIVTPTRRTARETEERLSEFWRSLGANVVDMDPDEHDRIVASVSHLPHLVAAALAAATPVADLPFAASGWADTTRIAAGDVAMWRQIFAANRDHVLHSLQRFEQLVAKFRRALEQDHGEEIAKLLAMARDRKEQRDTLGS